MPVDKKKEYQYKLSLEEDFLSSDYQRIEEELKKVERYDLVFKNTDMSNHLDLLYKNSLC